MARNRLCDESLYSLIDLAKLIPLRRNVNTLRNWHTKGVRNPQGRLCFLETILIGRIRCSSTEAVDRFLEELNKEPML